MTVQVTKTMQITRTTYVIRWKENTPVGEMLHDLQQVSQSAVMQDWDIEAESHFFKLTFLDESPGQALMP